MLENIDGSPESILLESLLEGLNEYFSKNLAREVQKGKKENALQAKHVGGVPPLGYLVDPQTMKLEKEPFEAQAVQLIFRMYLEGEGYTKIINTLNQKGYRTKRGKPFGKNSIYEVLRNEKYCGTYVYNKASARDARGKMNRHTFKNDTEIIRVPNSIPAIVTQEEFDRVQAKMLQNKHRPACHKAKQIYLLSGKIKCGVCGSAYAGNFRRARPSHPAYSSYRCTKHNGAVNCKNKEIRSETLDRTVLDTLANRLFDEALLPELYRRYADFAARKEAEVDNQLPALQKQLENVQEGIDNIVGVITQTGSAALVDQLRNLEQQKAGLDLQIQEQMDIQKSRCPDYEKLRTAFASAKRLLKEGNLHCVRRVIEEYIDVVRVFPEYIEIVLKAGLFKETVVKERNLLN